MKPQTLDLFASNPQDLPLFSGTAPHAQESTFNPQPTTRQVSLFTCTYCQDTGTMTIITNGRKIQRPCNCRRPQP